LSGVNCASAVAPLLTLMSRLSSRILSPWATSALFTTRSTACPFWTVISAGSKENFFAVTSTRRGAFDVADTGSMTAVENNMPKIAAIRMKPFCIVPLQNRALFQRTGSLSSFGWRAPIPIRDALVGWQLTSSTVTSRCRWRVIHVSEDCHDFVAGKKSTYAPQFTSLCALAERFPSSALRLVSVTFRLQREDDSLTPRDLFGDSFRS